MPHNVFVVEYGNRAWKTDRSELPRAVHFATYLYVLVLWDDTKCVSPVYGLLSPPEVLGIFFISVVIRLPIRIDTCTPKLFLRGVSLS